MITEDDLYALGREDAGPAMPCRPLDDVVARGRRLRRRRQVLRSVGVSVVVVATVGTGLVAAGRQSGEPDGEGSGRDGHADVAAGNDPTTSATGADGTGDTPSAPPPPPPDCDNGLVAPEAVPADQIADELRVLPTWTPGGEPITLARGDRWPDTCPEAAAYPTGEALELRANGGDGTVDAQITVRGPLPWLLSEVDEDMIAVGGTRPTSLRGQEASLRGAGGAEGLTFEWTEPDGWSWELRGDAVDEATLRAVGEALVLDSSPEGDESPVALGPADVPGGFEVTWQQRGLPEAATGDTIRWTVEVGEPATQEHPVQTGIRCMLEVRHDDTPITSHGGVGSAEATVNGQPAVWGPWPVAAPDPAGMSLTWDVGPGVRATAGCIDWGTEGNQSLPLENVVRLAESVEPVAADDPRLPG